MADFSCNLSCSSRKLVERDRKIAHSNAGRLATFNKGIEVHEVDGRSIRVYGVARTVVDCFKYRNKIGLDVALEALRFARKRKRTSNRELLEIARAAP